MRWANPLSISAFFCQKKSGAGLLFLTWHVDDDGDGKPPSQMIYPPQIKDPSQIMYPNQIKSPPLLWKKVRYPKKVSSRQYPFSGVSISWPNKVTGDWHCFEFFWRSSQNYVLNKFRRMCIRSPASYLPGVLLHCPVARRNFVKSDDIRILRDIEQFYSTQIDEMPARGPHPQLEFVKQYSRSDDFTFSYLFFVFCAFHTHRSVMFSPPTLHIVMFPSFLKALGLGGGVEKRHSCWEK